MVTNSRCEGQIYDDAFGFGRIKSASPSARSFDLSAAPASGLAQPPAMTTSGRKGSWQFAALARARSNALTRFLIEPGPGLGRI